MISSMGQVVCCLGHVYSAVWVSSAGTNVRVWCCRRAFQLRKSGTQRMQVLERLQPCPSLLTLANLDHWQAQLENVHETGPTHSLLQICKLSPGEQTAHTTLC